ncbi:hypothetical protein ACFVWR_13010 [Leifsonia sp. NPDC058292]|uniref:hypothetical protein n=1 Tax=Leifsonia sp. NPDC058292 TaxID=3346428 RepID=UPI0036DA3881
MTIFRHFRSTAAVVAALCAGALLAGCTAEDRGLPDGLPGIVQVEQGTVSNAVVGSGKSWSFTLTVPDAAAQKAAVVKLKDAGFRELGSNKTDASTTYSLANAKENINATLLLTTRDGRHLVIYNLVKVK